MRELADTLDSVRWQCIQASQGLAAADGVMRELDAALGRAAQAVAALAETDQPKRAACATAPPAGQRTLRAYLAAGGDEGPQRQRQRTKPPNGDGVLQTIDLVSDSDEGGSQQAGDKMRETVAEGQGGRADETTEDVVEWERWRNGADNGGMAGPGLR